MLPPNTPRPGITALAGLTRLESRILNVIEQHIQTQGIAPTIAEIASELSVSSRGTVHRYVQSLIKKRCSRRVGPDGAVCA